MSSQGHKWGIPQGPEEHAFLRYKEMSWTRARFSPQLTYKHKGQGSMDTALHCPVTMKIFLLLVSLAYVPGQSMLHESHNERNNSVNC